MFFNNKAINMTAMSLLLTTTENLKLCSNIHDAYKDINTEEIHDVEIRKLVEAVKTFSSDIFSREIRTSQGALNYFALCSIPDDVKELILEKNTFVSEKIQNDYVSYFANLANHGEINRFIDYMNTKWDKLSKSSLSKIQTDTSSFIDAIENLTKATRKFTNDTADFHDFVVNINDVGGTTTYGLDKVQEEIVKTGKNKLRTNTWMDHITGGGFEPQLLYMVGSISGGGKSLWLQNIAEEISMAMKPEDFNFPVGTTPALLYVNLEMSKKQLLQRKISFYDEDYEYIINGNGSGNRLEDRLVDMLRKHGSEIPVIYLTEDSTKRKFTIHQLKTAIQRYEKQGFKIVGVFTDYLDKFAFNASDAPSERERDEPITLKAYDHKDLAKEFRVPVITGFQLNKLGEDALKGRLHKAKYEDIVKGVTPICIGKAHSLTNVPDHIYFCYKFGVDDPEVEGKKNYYFSLVVDKDRDNVAKYKANPKNRAQRKKLSKRGKGGDSRVYYCVKIETIWSDETQQWVHSSRLGNNYASSIKEWEASSDAYNVMDMEEEEEREMNDAEVVIVSEENKDEKTSSSDLVVKEI